MYILWNYNIKALLCSYPFSILDSKLLQKKLYSATEFLHQIPL